MYLTDSNFQIFAAKYYDNPVCFDTEEFLDDLKRFKYLKRLFLKYHETGEFKIRLILNHITVIFNVFGTKAGTKMLFFKLKGFYSELKSILSWMQILPTYIDELGDTGDIIFTDPIKYDFYVLKLLQEVEK